MSDILEKGYSVEYDAGFRKWEIRIRLNGDFELMSWVYMFELEKPQELLERMAALAVTAIEESKNDRL